MLRGVPLRRPLLSYLRSTQDVIINHASAIFSTRYTFLNAHVPSSPLINEPLLAQRAHPKNTNGCIFMRFQCHIE